MAVLPVRIIIYAFIITDIMGRNEYHGQRGRRGGFRGGFKRGREEQAVLDPRKVLLSTLLYLGDDCMPVCRR